MKCIYIYICIICLYVVVCGRSQIDKDLRVQIEFYLCIEFLREAEYTEFISMFNDAHT